MFGKHRLAGTSYGPLASSTEADALVARRRALVALHRRRAQIASQGKALHASLLAHPLCWSNRMRHPLMVPAAAEVAHQTPRAEEAAPQPVAPRQAAPHQAHQPQYMPAGSWNAYLPWGSSGLS